MIRLPACPLCGWRRSGRYYGRGAPDHIPVHNRLCDRCGLIFQSPRMDAAEMAAYYARYTQATQPAIADIPLSFEEHVTAIARLRLDNLRPFLKDGMRVLDIGCSFGAFLATLRDGSGVSLSLTGVNPEPSLADFGKRRWGLDIRVGMFEDQRFDDGMFDLVVLDNVIEHFDDPVAAVVEINRITAPGGLLMVATNNARRPHGLYWQNFFLDHSVTFTPETLTAMLRWKGYEVESMNNDGHVTSRGYHYPYTVAIARKAASADARPLEIPADHTAAMRRFVGDYVRACYAENGLGKRLYELSRSPSPWVRGWGRLLEATLGRWRAEPAFEMPSHTLPPDSHRCRWAFAAFCDTYSDGAKAIALEKATGMAAEFFLFRRREDGGYFTAMAPAGPRPDFATADESLAWVELQPRPAQALIRLDLRDAPVVPEEWAARVIAFMRSDADRLRLNGDAAELHAIRTGHPIPAFTRAS